MKRAFVMLVAVLGVSLMACGGEGLEVRADESQPGLDLAETSQELVTCTTSCPGGTVISCTGATCSTVNAWSVTCDGVRTLCPPSVCPGDYRSCASLNGRSCRGGTESCCRGDVEGSCVCFNGRFSC